MVTWIHALHVQIGISAENHRLYEAEILITEDAVSRSEEAAEISFNMEPSLLQRVLSRDETSKVFRDFLCSEQDHALIDAWIECEKFCRKCLARESGVALSLSSASSFTTRTSKEEWDQLKTIIKIIQGLSVLNK